MRPRPNVKAHLGLNGLHLGGALQLRVGQRVREDLDQQSKEHDRQSERLLAGGGHERAVAELDGRFDEVHEASEPVLLHKGDT